MAKILIVDDNSDHAETLKAILSAAGHRVFAETSSKKVFEFLRTERPELIILDVNMPEMDGFEVAQLLKANDSTKDISLLMQSATSQVGDVFERALEAGAEDFIQMPADKKEVIARVKICLERRKVRDELTAGRRFLVDVLDSLTHPFYVIDAANYKIVMANAASGLPSDLTNVTGHNGQGKEGDRA